MKVAVVGATGMVGSVMLKVLEERNFPLTELIPVASERSVGKKLTYNGKPTFEMLAVRAKNNGMEIELTESLRIGDGAAPQDYLVQQFSLLHLYQHPLEILKRREFLYLIEKQPFLPTI